MGMSEKTGRQIRFEDEQLQTADAEAEVYSILKPIIDKHDLEQLLTLGAPADEYEPTCKRIAKEIVRERSNRLSEVELGNLLALAWHMEFRMWGDQVRYHEKFFEVAKEIKPLLPAPRRLL